MRISRGALVAALVAAIVALVLGASPAFALSPPVDAVRMQAAIAADLTDSLAVKADGSLWFWGFYQEGDDESSSAGILTPARVGVDSDWAMVSDGVYNALALKADGSLWDIEVAPASEDESSAAVGGLLVTPVRVGTEASWASVSAGGFYGSSLGIKKDGSLWTLDYDLAAEPGDPNYGVIVPVRLGADEDWAAVSASPVDGSLALKTDGSLWSIEWVPEDASAEEAGPMKTVVAQVGTDKDWTAVSAGGGHSLALKADGSLWAWGDNSAGQLGDGTTTDQESPARIGTDTDWVVLSAGASSSLALKADGTLWAWGDNSYGQLGDGTTTDRHAPTRVGTSNKWRAITAGDVYSLGLRLDGTLWAWGDNSYGQLGDGTVDERHVPTKVLADVQVPPWPDTGDVFSDVAGSPYEAAIYDLAGRGVITGFEDGTFHPNDPVSRQQFVKMIVKALALPLTGSEACPFADVLLQTASDPLYPSRYVTICAVRGITQGKTATTFDPYRAVTREQLVTMIVRAASLPDPPVAYEPNFGLGQFSLAEHHKNARKAAYVGLLEGLRGVGPLYNFGAAANRGECAQILHNLLNRLES